MYKTQVLRNAAQVVIGRIEEQGNRLVLRGKGDIRLGEFDGTYTRDSSGKIVGTGNLLTTLLRG